ncbi:unnamed protein product [Rotaria sp. Silwood2]|nr:unnamed protein product [Rotaria sp. Silwood2]CAF2960880.1 unnamed protein product [Rotaria sp. Silwood2]CAF3263955.1 unnamed protein product [Rotaria sp. Silwood2]CAF3349527.1 unnamed protein product [Rotaria sp. Silwood2]CAF4143425.1 unnamed protein product [Rotaria sp. Silwood2]
MEEQFMSTLAKEQIKNLAKFGGGPEEDVIKWLQEVEEVFDRAQLQPSNKYLAVQSYLVESAAKWFRHNKLNICDWSTFKIEILKVYRPSLDQTLLKMEQRQQLSNELVMEYYYDKLQLCLQADPNMSLNSSLISYVVRRHPSTPAEFLVIAQDEEKIQQMLQGLTQNTIRSHDDDDDSNDKDLDDEMIALVKRPTYTKSRSFNSQQQ